MSWINPLDKVPQIPQDYANHYIYGQALFVVLLIIGFSCLVAGGVLLAVAAGKKIIDYRKEMEPLTMCVAKTIVTVLGGVVPWLCTALHLIK